MKENKQIGIYQILNIKTKRSYIGKTNDFFKRKKRHLDLLSARCHFSKSLQQDYDEYGKESLIFGMLLPCSKEELNLNELKFIKKLKPSYNILMTRHRKVRNPSSESTIHVIKRIRKVVGKLDSFD